MKFQATILQQTAEYIEKLEREKKQMRQLLQAQNPSFKNSEIMILPNSDSEKEVKEETPNIPQVKGSHIRVDQNKLC